MPRAPILALLRLHILVCIAVSAALLHDYSSSSHAAFCAVGSGCDAVRQSAYARVAGVPLPVVGLLAFAGLFGLTMFDHRVRRAWLAPVATVGAVSGVALLLIQHLALHTFCKLCVTVDVASIFAAGLAWLYRSVGNEGNDGAVHPMGWGGAALAAFIAPYAFAQLQPPPPVKPAIARYWEPDRLTIVELSDFECPFCRALHPQLMQAMDGLGTRVKFVRVNVALPGHHHSRPASKMYLCAGEQGLGEQAADVLFTTDVATQGPEALAAQLGPSVSLVSLRKCVDDPRTDARVTADFRRAVDEIGFEGLPTVWIGAQSVMGFKPAESLRAVIDRELKETRTTARAGIPAVWLWAALGLALIGLTVMGARPKAEGGSTDESR